jgi:WD40 repeat protein
VKQLLVLNLDGDFTRGFSVHWEIGSEDRAVCRDGYSKLHPMPGLDLAFRAWDRTYRGLDGINRIKIKPNQITNVRYSSLQLECGRQAKNLARAIDDWFERSDLSRVIREQLIPTPGDEYRAIVRTTDLQARQLPWHLWSGWRAVDRLEIALSTPQGRRRDRIYQQQVRVLVVLGNSEGIDIEADRQLLAEYCRGADLTILSEPTRSQLSDRLLDKRGWDILFFSGHSSTEGNGTSGRIWLNRTDSLTMVELRRELQTAIAGGLQLAVFNSCDGLGTAAELETLYIPHAIFMRQPVPDRVAQTFLKYFLAAFTGGASLARSVNIARDRLQELETEFPCASWLPVLIQNRLAIPPTWQSLGAIANCPYRGLAAFAEEDKDYFYGREEFVASLVEDLKTRSLVPLIGASGSGKSSLVFAGLIPQLRQDDLHWQILCLRPGTEPIMALATAVTSLAAAPALALELARSIAIDELAVVNFISESGLNGNLIQSHSPNYRLLLVIDRFEELYTLTPDRSERRQFLTNILNLLDRSSEVKLLFALRADFYDRLLEDYPLVIALERTQSRHLTPMTRAELTQAIVMPAQKLNVRFEDGLVERIVDSTLGERHILPLLEFTLTQLWTKQRDGNLTHRGYEEIGGIDRALVDRAEAIYAQLTASEQTQARYIFGQLVRVGERAPATRRMTKRAELDPHSWSLVEHLAAVRLVTIDRAEIAGDETVELIHEALIGYWDRLKLWIEIDGDFRHWQERLRATIDRWDKNGRDESELIRGRTLDTALDWTIKQPDRLRRSEAEFIQLSATKQQQEITAKQRLQQRIIGGLVAGLTIATTLASIALWQWHQASLQRRSAISNRVESLASNARLLFESGNRLAALQQARLAAVEIASESELTSEFKLPALATLSDILDRIQERRVLAQHTNSVASIAYSRDGKFLVSAGWDNRINIWTANGRSIQTLVGDNERFFKVIIHPNSREIITASFERGVKIWHRHRQTGLWMDRSQGILDRPVTALALSRDGLKLAIATQAASIQFYPDLRNAPLKYRSLPTSSLINDLSFSAEGREIVAANNDGTLKIWTIEGKLSRTITGGHGKVSTVAVSPDGKTIAAGTSDGTISLWNDRGQLPLYLQRQPRSILGLNFSPNGKILAATSEDRQIKLWNATTGKLVDTLQGHQDSVNEVSFSPDGRTLGSASTDRTVRLWQIARPPATIVNRATRFGYNPLHDILVIGGTPTGTITILNRDRQVVRQFTAHQAEIIGIGLSTDGEYLATTDSQYQLANKIGFKNSQVKLWTKTGRLIATLPGYRVSFSPTRSVLAIATSDGKVNIYDPSGRSISSWQTQQSSLNTLNFSPDGRSLVTGDKAIKIWDLNGKLLDYHSIGTGRILNVSYSSNSDTLAIASDCRPPLLYSLQDRSIRTLGNNIGTTATSFSNDGTVVLTGDTAGNIQLWSRTGRLLMTIFTPIHRGSSISQVGFINSDNEILAIDTNGRMSRHNLDLKRLLTLADRWQAK